MFEKIMVVEDDTNFRLLLVDQLLKSHYEIIQAEDGEQAIAKLANNKPRLVILDLLLPKQDGFAVLEHLQKEINLATTPVIVYSNFDKQEYVEKARSFNVQSYLIKSQVTIESLCKQVEEILKSGAEDSGGN